MIRAGGKLLMLVKVRIAYVYIHYSCTPVTLSVLQFSCSSVSGPFDLQDISLLIWEQFKISFLLSCAKSYYCFFWLHFLMQNLLEAISKMEYALQKKKSYSYFGLLVNCNMQCWLLLHLHITKLCLNFFSSANCWEHVFFCILVYGSDLLSDTKLSPKVQ